MLSVEKLLSDPKHGRILKTYAEMTLPKGTTDDSDIRHQYDLGGGVSTVIPSRSLSGIQRYADVASSL